MGQTANGIYFPDGLEASNNPPADFQTAGQSIDTAYGKSVASWAALVALTGNYKGRRVWVEAYDGVATWNGTKWLAPDFRLSKATDEDRTNDTLTADADFVYQIPQAGTYDFEFDLMMLCQSGQTGDVQFGFDFPSGTLDVKGHGADVGIGAGTAAYAGFWRQRREVSQNDSALAFGTTSSFTLGVRLIGTLEAAAGGAFELLWAQNVTNANAATMFARSIMRVKNPA